MPAVNQVLSALEERQARIEELKKKNQDLKKTEDAHRKIAADHRSMADAARWQQLINDINIRHLLAGKPIKDLIETNEGKDF